MVCRRAKSQAVVEKTWAFTVRFGGTDGSEVTKVG
jgi:hypothetical protein